MNAAGLTAHPHPRRITAAPATAHLWVAPRPQRSGHTFVLHFTDTEGTGHAIELDLDAVADLAQDADRILAATPEQRETWIDQAAEVVIAEATRRSKATQ